MENANERKDVGAMWARAGKNGVYFGLTINGVKYLAFKNNFKKAEKHPDYRIFPNTFTGTGGKGAVDLGDAPPF